MRERIVGISLLAGLSFLCCGCAPAPAPDEERDASAYEEDVSQPDPLEPLNRGVFFFNRCLDNGLFRPVALTYRAVVPEPARDSVDSVLSTLLAPVSCLNHLLQGRLDEAGQTVVRFAVNSTIGVLGLVDMAENMGFAHNNDVGFDDTLAAWGLDPGAYLVLPILGPSSLRGVVGLGADFLTDPLQYHYAQHNKRHEAFVYGRAGVTLVHRRHQVLDTLDPLLETALDPYAAVRSVYYQRLAYQKERLRAR